MARCGVILAGINGILEQLLTSLRSGQKRPGENKSEALHKETLNGLFVKVIA